MPPKAAKKKTRVEMRAELYLAMQQAAQASQQAPEATQQASQQAPEATQQAPEASQQAPEATQQAPEATQQASVLPLVLLVPSTHSTTGSTSPAPPTRSIRCSFVTTQPPTEPCRDVS